MYSAWRSEVRQWVWCEAVWAAVACEMQGLASTGVWPDGREVAVRTLRSPDIFSKLTELSKSWIQPVPNMLRMPVPPNTLRIRLSRTLSAASPTVQDRPHPCLANEDRGHTHRSVSAFILPTLSGSVPLSDVPYISLRMRRPLSCTQGHAHSLRCLRYLTVTAQLAARVPPHSRAHSAAMGIWLTGSAWVLV